MGFTRGTAVFCIYVTAESADTALDDLVNSGFTCSDISILLQDNESTRAFAVEKNTKASEAATAGASTGGIVGSGLGLLAILGELAIPGAGPMIAGGPILATLIGVAVAGLWAAW
jgi:flagellar motor component MotA